MKEIAEGFEAEWSLIAIDRVELKSFIPGGRDGAASE
jgi:hypothetical protein